MALTFQQMYVKYTDLWDKAGDPYMGEEEWDTLANMKYNDFVTKQCTISEETQELSNHIHDLYEKFSKLNSDVILIPDDVPNFRYLLSFNSKYRKNCGGRISYPVINIRKAPNNNAAVMQRDPFNKGIDEDPSYEVTKVGAKKALKVNADTVPLELSGLYCREPQKIDSFNTPGGLFELPDYVGEALIRATVVDGDIIIENFQRAQFGAQNQSPIINGQPQQ